MAAFCVTATNPGADDFPNRRIAGLAEALRRELGPRGVLAGTDLRARPAGIWRHDTIAAPLLLRPATTPELATVLRACHAAEQPVVVHGGLTGLVEGAVAGPADVVVSTERMRTIEALDRTDRTLVAEAGVTLAAAQDAAADVGLMLPIDLGARGSCTLGGMVATNAGGHQVIRYGMTRESVLGLEVVLADGTIISALNGMLKNNAGYDLKQLFIGTEGTLGVVSRVVLRLRPAWKSQETALVACPDFPAVARLLGVLDAELGGTLTSFELLWQSYYELVAGPSGPLPGGFPYYVLIEALGSSAEEDSHRFMAALSAALERGLVSDARVCKSGAERATLWSLRDSVEKALACGPGLIFDVSLRLSAMERYVAQVRDNLDAAVAGHLAWVFGHAADGNLHIVVVPDPERPPAEPVPGALRKLVERAVYEPLQAIGGSISGEHGIGIEKRPWLAISRSAEEIALMRALKHALDPRGILNRGRVLVAEDA